MPDYTKNARLLVWHRSEGVKITLRPGQTLSFGYSELTDEGYSASRSTFYFDGVGVHAEYLDTGRDCDGRHEHFHRAYCHRDLLTGHHVDGERWPDWDHLDSSQRDHTAESMNY